MQKMKDKIEDAENREHDAKEECKEVEATLGQNETDIDSMKKRIQLLTKELDEKNALLEERKMKSGQLEEKYEKENEVVRELENVEIGEDERMHELETDLTETSQKAEQLELQNTELRQKLGQLENEIQKVWASFYYKIVNCSTKHGCLSSLNYVTEETYRSVSLKREKYFQNWILSVFWTKISADWWKIKHTM